MQRTDPPGRHADQQLGRAHLQQHGPFLGSQTHIRDDTHRTKAVAAQIAHAPREPGAQENGAEHDAQRDSDLADACDTGHRDTGDGPGAAKTWAAAPVWAVVLALSELLVIGEGALNAACECAQPG